MIPAPTRLDGDLGRAQEMLARVTASLDAAGPRARAFSRCALTVQSPEAVDALAAAWGVKPMWSAERTQYVARLTTPGYEADAEAVYYAPAAEAGETATGAVA
jgi:hypothetical protein